jgi:DNA-binding LacI/PurR family transcriptional regulator
MQRFETITKVQQATNHLRRQVLTGVLAPGQRLPSERALCKEYALSRVTVNKITSALVQDGLLERRGPQGTFVVGINGRAATVQIGFLMQTSNPHEVNPVSESVLRAFVRASHTKQARVMFGMMGNWGKTLPPGFDPSSLDALVLAGTAPEDQIAPFIDARRPVLWVDEVYNCDVRYVISTDHFEAGRLAADHLLSRGRRAIVAMGYPLGSYLGFEKRLEGFRAAHAAYGVPIDERRILRPYYSQVEHVVEILRQLERDGLTFDAVFGLADLIGIWNINALSRIGKRVPQDVAVIGVDGLPAGDWTHPRLTTVAQPVDEIGELALSRVLSMLNSGRFEDQPQRIKPRLIVKEST